jgi:hypothetical protein
MDFKLFFALIISVINFTKGYLMNGHQRDANFYVNLVYVFFAFVPNLVNLIDFLMGDENKFKKIKINLYKFFLMDAFDSWMEYYCAMGKGVYSNQASVTETRHSGGEMLTIARNPLSDDKLKEILGHDYKGTVNFKFIVNKRRFIEEMEFNFDGLEDLYNSFVNIWGMEKAVFYLNICSIFFGAKLTEDVNFQAYINNAIKQRGEITPNWLQQAFRWTKGNNENWDVYQEHFKMVTEREKFYLNFCLVKKDDCYIRVGEMNDSFKYYMDTKNYTSADIISVLKRINVENAPVVVDGAVKIGIVDVELSGSELRIRSRDRVVKRLPINMRAFWYLDLMFILNWWAQNPTKGVYQTVDNLGSRGSKVCSVYKIEEILNHLQHKNTPMSHGYNSYSRGIYIND